MSDASSARLLLGGSAPRLPLPLGLLGPLLLPPSSSPSRSAGEEGGAGGVADTCTVQASVSLEPLLGCLG